ncbi:MAG: ATP-dependent helicase [Bacteroidales bacterium]|nr:ATP-dependent helicase [Bacteroidales bacterium]
MDKAREAILEAFPNLNTGQKEAIFITDGPNLIIAGPGTGKTFTLTLRTLYLLLSGKAQPSEIVLTTFTQKASFELRDRLSQFSKKLNFKVNLHELITGTIHSICDNFILANIKQSALKKNYIILDDLTASLFINENFDKIVEPFKVDRKFFNRWQGKWDTISRIKKYFDKITEELVDPNDLLNSGDAFLEMIGESYNVYKEKLIEENRIDFAFLQRSFYDLLKNKTSRAKITDKIKYVLIDEYQDTNYIQEQIAFELSSKHKNICVVGDEDQALYRFRGATVRNILEFEGKFRKCRIIPLLENYRSHKRIISEYNNFITQVDWENPDGGVYFRYPNKELKPADSTISPDYPAIFSIWGSNTSDEANRFADMVQYLLKSKVIKDPSDVALLLRSVRLEHSSPFIEALNAINIRSFCPRARAFFENDEVLIIIACYALILGFIDDDLNNYEHHDIIEIGLSLMKSYIGNSLTDYIRRMAEKVNELEDKDTLDENLVDLIYQLCAHKPFSDYLKDENRARNISTLTALMSTFQTYYHNDVITAKSKNAIKYRLFNSYFRLLFNSGQNEFEDRENPIPKGYVQIMTIHQSKGLEFPVVAVGSLDKNYRVEKYVDRELGGFYQRDAFEPENRITRFDWARCFYVAFSRPQKILVLTTSTEPKDFFSGIWEGLDQWPHVKKDTLKAQKFESKPPYIPKKSLSLTSHINVYETCPQQYLFFKEYGFSPSRTGQILFGTLVHETIEDIHRGILDGEKVTPKQIENDFENNYKGLLANGMRPIGVKQKENALRHVLTYFKNNKDLLQRVIDTEVDVSIEKDTYIMNGKIDLLLGKDNKLELLDFKSQPKPPKNDPSIDKIRKQLNLYAYILKERYNKDPERLYIYWTSEERRKDALLEIEYNPKLVEEAGRYFDNVAQCIMNRDFTIKKKPDKTRVCKECDFRYYCKVVK